MVGRLAKLSQLLALLAVSCAPLTEPGYQGQPLFTVQGQVTASSGSAPPQVNLDAAVFWQLGAPPSIDDQQLAARAAVVSEPVPGVLGPSSGPSSSAGSGGTFSLTLYQPPPSAALQALAPGEPVFARAVGAAVPSGVVIQQIAALPTAASAGYGLDPNHWILYLPAAVPAGSLTEWWLGAALPAGFHVVRVTAVAPVCISAAQLAACATDVTARGVPDDGTANPGTARSFCLEPYRLAPAPDGEQILLTLGLSALPAAGACP
jgi:hypothetical protein